MLSPLQRTIGPGKPNAMLLQTCEMWIQLETDANKGWGYDCQGKTSKLIYL